MDELHSILNGTSVPSDDIVIDSKGKEGMLLCNTGNCYLHKNVALTDTEAVM